MQYFLFCTTVAVVVPLVMNGPVLLTVPDIDNDIPTQDELVIISREDWKGRAPKGSTPLETPVPHVIIHHTYEPGACSNREDCSKAMRSMQNFHVDGNGWLDIGYNFCVGGDGKVYEGRGWSVLGAHALHVNSVSIGICLIGDWRTELPPKIQLDAAKALIRKGLTLGYVRQDYTMLGHRQVRDTECPGDRLFAEIHSWKNFSAYPASHLDPLVAPPRVSAS